MIKWEKNSRVGLKKKENHFHVLIVTFFLHLISSEIFKWCSSDWARSRERVVYEIECLYSEPESFPSYHRTLTCKSNPLPIDH